MDVHLHSDPVPRDRRRGDHRRRCPIHATTLTRPTVLHAAARHGRDRVCLHRAARVPHARLVSRDVWTGERRRARWAAASSSRTTPRAPPARRLQSGAMVSALRRRRAVVRVPPGQRHLDDGHHLGRVDQPAARSAGRWACAACSACCLAAVGWAPCSACGRRQRRETRSRPSRPRTACTSTRSSPAKWRPTTTNALQRPTQAAARRARQVISPGAKCKRKQDRDRHGKAACIGGRRRVGRAGGDDEAGRAGRRRRSA